MRKVTVLLVILALVTMTSQGFAIYDPSIVSGRVELNGNEGLTGSAPNSGPAQMDEDYYHPYNFEGGSNDSTPAPIPEPTTLVLVGLGLMGAGLLRKKR
ncbi:MAG: PEP-CTERM sorting domain-containing protein [candidate division Zixibacteria bacterium]|nr:PEP-CTERM sorting domain-containing protein [candidate division Zixibacteria bacterium]